MEKEESNESTKFTEETSEKKPARREDKKSAIREMDEQSTETDNLLDYERDKDVGA